MLFVSFKVVYFVLEFFSMLKKFINLKISLVKIVPLSLELSRGGEELFFHLFDMVLEIADLIALVVNFITFSFFTASSWVASKSSLILLRVNSSSSTCMAKSLMLDSFSLSLELSLKT